MRTVRIAPSMMCVSPWENGPEILRELKDVKADFLHVDVMDGAFVPNLMLGTETIRQLRRASDIPLDIHLMIEHPEDKLQWFDIQPGEYVSVHTESTRHLQRVLAGIRDRGGHPVAALNPATPLCVLEEILPDIDAVLLMTVNPGFAGQKLIPQTLEKISRLRRMLAETGRADVLIEVDGNVSFTHSRNMVEAGADILVCGTSSLFSGEGTISENAARLRQI